MNDLKSILDKVLRATPHYEENKMRDEIFSLWPVLVGDKIAAHTSPLALLENGVLLIAADSNAWMHSLKFLEAEIIKRYQVEFKKRGKSSGIQQLRFKLKT